jgi:hypothetical protein
MTYATHKFALLCTALLLLRTPRLFAEPSVAAAAVAAFNTYARTVESRLTQQHSSPNAFLILPTDPTSLARLRSGQLLIEKITTPTAPDALLHHWRATAFVPNTGVPGDPKGRWGGNVTAADFERLLQNFSAYPHNFAPQIISTTVLSHTPTDTIARLRTRQHHVITVVLDTTVDVTFATLDPTHAYSISRSTRVDQISPSGDDGFLYRLNTY